MAYECFITSHQHQATMSSTSLYFTRWPPSCKIIMKVMVNNKIWINDDFDNGGSDNQGCTVPDLYIQGLLLLMYNIRT